MTVTRAPPGAETHPVAFVSATVRVSVPAAPAVKMMELVPSPPVIVPFEIPQL